MRNTWKSVRAQNGKVAIAIELASIASLIANDNNYQ